MVPNHQPAIDISPTKTIVKFASWTFFWHQLNAIPTTESHHLAGVILELLGYELLQWMEEFLHQLIGG